MKTLYFNEFVPENYMNITKTKKDNKYANSLL